MKQKEPIGKVKKLHFPNMKVNVFIPKLTPEEKEKRMAVIRKAAANLIKTAK